MTAPKNPNTVIIRNAYYPQGLTEQQIWDHYQKYKNKILNEISGRPVLLFIAPEENQIVIRRFLKHRLIKLSPNNYDNIINGRTVSISVECGVTLEKLIVDIDVTVVTPTSMTLDAVGDVINVFKKIPEVDKIKVFMTGQGFHVYGMLKGKMNYVKAINIVKKNLTYSVGDKYSIGEKRKETLRKFINLDVSPMYSRGSYVVPYSLNRNGLICADVTKNWKTVKRSDMIVK